MKTEGEKKEGDGLMLKKSSVSTIVVFAVCVGVLLFAHNTLQAQKGPTKIVSEGTVKTSEKGYGVVLKGYNAYEKVKIIRAVADVKGVKAVEAVDMVNFLPFVVLEGVTKEEADKVAQQLKKSGCSVEVRHFK